MSWKTIPTLEPLKNSNNDKIIDFSTFDIETTEWINPYALGYYNPKEGYKVFIGTNCVDEFMQHILRRKSRGLTIYAHNGGKFDFSFLLRQMMNKDYLKKYSADITRAAGRIIELRINFIEWVLDTETGKKKPTYRTAIRFRDSVSLLPFSLEKITKSYGVEHAKGEIDHTKITKDNWKEHIEEVKPYLYHDCKGLHEVLVKHQNYSWHKWKIGFESALTGPSKALRNYRRNFMKAPIVQYPHYEDVIRRSYCGGRTEIFQHYLTGGAYYYDVNSLYPSVMKGNPYPVGYPIKTHDFNLKDNFGICKATVDIPKSLDIPPLPYKQIINKQTKLLFPTGKLKGWFTSPELILAKEQGCKINIDVGLDFKKDYIFDDYVGTIYPIKENAKDNVEKTNAKGDLNMLYGKFGQRRDREQFIFNPKELKGLTPLTLDDSIPIYSKKVVSKSKHILPAIASFVTSYSRIAIYGFLKDSDPYYCDTDSVITKKKIRTSTKLGDMKLEHHIKEGVFILPKMYAFRCFKDCPDKDHVKKGFDSVKIKGFPRTFVKENVTFEMLKDCFMKGNFSRIDYREKGKFTTVFESLRRTHKFVSTNEFKRSIKSKYDKRTLIEGTFRTKPLHIDETFI